MLVTLEATPATVELNIVEVVPYVEEKTLEKAKSSISTATSQFTSEIVTVITAEPIESAEYKLDKPSVDVTVVSPQQAEVAGPIQTGIPY